MKSRIPPRRIEGEILPAPRASYVIPNSPARSNVETPQPSAYLRALWNHKWLLLLFTIAGGTLGWLAVWRQPYIYQAHAYVEVQGLNEDLLNRRELDPTAPVDNSSQNYVNTQGKILQSGVLFDRVASRLDAQQGGTASRPLVNHMATRREIARSVKVRTHEGDRILEVVSESTDPRRAAIIANTLTSEFIQQDMESRWASSRNTSQWLAKELEELAGKLRSSENELQRFAERSNLVLEPDQSEADDGRLRHAQEELARAQADRAVKQSIYESAKDASASGSSGPSPDATAEQYEIQLSGLNKQLAELESTYTPTYYKIPPLKAQITLMEKALSKQRETARKRIENDYKAAQRREALLQNQYAAQFKFAAGQSAKIVQYAALKNQVDTNRTIYSQMLQKVKGYGVTAAMQASNLRLVDPAEPPLFPSRPNKPLITVLSAFGFLCFGSFFVLARAAGSRNIMEPGEMRQYLQLQELGVIPAADSAPARLTAMSSVARSNGGGRQPLETIAWHSRLSMVAESFRATSASLLLPGRGSEKPRILVVTSVSPSEGKTTVASNMAISLAGSGSRVLLVDGDRRRARLHKIFECQNSQGLTELLDEAGPPDLDRFVCRTTVPNLSILPSGRDRLASSDILYSPRMRELIELLRQRFDTVVIDTPPVLHLPDARILGRLSDGVILVLRAGRVKRNSVAAAEQRLRDDGIPILGAVLNDWNPRKNGYGAYPEAKSAYTYFST